MARYFLTLISAGLAVVLFVELISLIDISGPPRGTGSWASAGPAAAVAIFFVLTELVFGRVSLNQYKDVVLNATLVSSIGSFGLVLILFLAGVVAGYAQLRFITSELLSVFLFGIILLVLTLPFILVLHTLMWGMQAIINSKSTEKLD
jgi:hypothetical protein